MFIAKQYNEEQEKYIIVVVADTKEKLEEKIEGFTECVIEETETEYILYNGQYLTQAEIDVKERERLDALTLTPADTWRALYKAKQMRSNDLLALIEEKLTGVDMNLVEIEFGANLFYRGAKLGSGRLFDVIAPLLGYTADDMDYLFEYKELPDKSLGGANG